MDCRDVAEMHLHCFRVSLESCLLLELIFYKMYRNLVITYIIVSKTEIYFALRRVNNNIIFKARSNVCTQ